MVKVYTKGYQSYLLEHLFLNLTFCKMKKNAADVIICLILTITISILVVVNLSITQVTDFLKNSIPDYNWIIHGIQNVFGYSTIFLPGFIVYKYVRKIDYLNKSSNHGLTWIIRSCFDEELIDVNKNSLNFPTTLTLVQTTLLLLFYFVGLQVSFLTWGVLQEKIMTQNYTNVEGNISRFGDSQFLVFINRILAFCMSGMVILFSRQPRHKAPLYKYVFCSFSNILSSWCQYEALKYVSFPHQVLAKSAKTIPVLLMGRIISKTKYECYEYVTVLILSSGMLFFMFDTDNNHKSSSVTTFSGIILLCSYIVFDSFTSNWQGALFKQYGMNPVQMMCGVNMFSCVFTAVSLLQQGGLVSSFNFMLQYPAFTVDCFLLSICSAAGQLFIFRTIASFGPLVFAIITTIRQGLSVFLSCIIYGHHIGTTGIFGIILIFFSVFLRIYCAYRSKMNHKHTHGAKL